MQLHGVLQLLCCSMEEGCLACVRGFQGRRRLVHGVATAMLGVC
jgi:hypothetical protein